MGRGVGKTQWRILEVLRARPEHWEEVTRLALCAYHPERFLHDGKYYYNEDPEGGYICERSKIVATHRAIKGLERWGLVQTRIRKNALSDGQGGARWWKECRLSDESIAYSQSNQHICQQ